MSDLGVVDPIRVPAPLAGLTGRFRRLPTLARVFITLAAVDALVRTLGLLEPHARLDVGLVSAVGGYVPRDLWILLPAILLVRRPSVGADMPTLFRGAVLVAIVTLVAQPTLALVTNATQQDFLANGDLSDLTLVNGLSVIRAIAISWGFVMVGLGLGGLNPREPRPVVAGLANVVVLGIVLAFVVPLASVLAVDAFGSARSNLDLVPFAGAAVEQLALAFLLRAAVRGMDDPARAERATRSAASGAVLLALGNAIEGTLSVLSAFAQVNPGLQGAAIDVSIWSSTVVAVLVLSGYVLLVAGFALGLANPLRPLAKDWEAAAAPA